ncbi:MAG TPA: site-2 protease family protein [Terriglobales bacterium]|nr:site-2 protease family protein [Terriglobales bacterium]
MPAAVSRKLVEFPLPIRVDKLTQIMRVCGVPVYVHWSVWLIALLILFNVIHNPAKSLLGLVAYFSVLLIHESGHLIAAQRMHCEVRSIQLYPIFGVTHFETPWSKLDHCIIAWGGVIAQAVVAVPIVVAVSIFGYSRLGPINAFLAILGFYSLGVAIFNLLPIRPLDGSVAWAIIPEAIRHFWNRKRDAALFRRQR